MSTSQENMFRLNERPEAEPRPRKRRRRTMACTQCRSRKLKCDREYPTCGRCKKSKTPIKCTYEDGFLWQQPNTIIPSSGFQERGSTGADASHSSYVAAQRLTSSPDSEIGTAPRQSGLPEKRSCKEKRDGFLETVLGQTIPPAPRQQKDDAAELPRSTTASRPTANSADGTGMLGVMSASQPLNMENRVMARGKETRTRFNGGGIFANLMVQFSELRNFVEGIKAANPNLVRLRQDIETLKRGHHKKKLNQPLLMPDVPTLVAMLPSRDVVEELVDVYCTYIESTHRILHMPSFRREIDDFWEKRSNPSLISAPFLVQLMLVLACAWNLADPDRLSEVGAANTKRYTAIDYIVQADNWLETVHVKRPDVVILRIHCLLLIAKNNQGIKRSRAWLTTGSLVKMAMLAGYHRDPDQWTGITVFNKEMRRRIWSTILELDLQVSIDRGMPPTLQASDYDTCPAANINDEELSADSTELPPERPLTEPTDTSFHAFLSQSLPLRLKACALMNGPRITCSYEDIQRIDCEFTRVLSSIPSWSIPDPMDQKMVQKTMLWTALLETKLCQFLLAIHTPFAIDAHREPMFVPSSRTRLEVAMTMLSRQQLLYETSTQLSLCHLTDSIPQACLSVCHHLYTTNSGYTSVLARQIVPAITGSLLGLVDKTLDALESKARVVVKGAKYFFFTNMIRALVKSKLWPNETELYKKQAVDRIATFACNLLSRHTDTRHDKSNQTHELTPGSSSDPCGTNFDGILPQSMDFSFTPPGDFDAFLDAFNWEDMAAFAYPENPIL
ncbi:transcriptional regulator family: Fungal Specific TF [Paecilomyces variotii]|uniref:Putative C6 transcription factor n=1 Tax=Byssochlamys spectabilis TaxID=264951 RepID=A0A443HWQ7_BYSSP|nr:putative C6 transcription factor [Paecilomyces variotii]KAJ9213019.1 transcriptional regulator family: Fungal Specific TF [Paecilomyces variotii]KAJ9218597.1 transcriptional regulator family: Fungal Specific TF [Paecilomyces variotii]KAJ9234218.1 transcriptional regulator family: Fungal Specific TF [Paecilomyces variotii]KAJ9284028.1 transcriptional regulator family: Fungal Specific TF [Paecilomyces variotii]KAJ9327639.1 transcriptional regulator family: Fungal Specific TF [Paecilomyces var